VRLDKQAEIGASARDSLACTNRQHLGDKNDDGGETHQEACLTGSPRRRRAHKQSEYQAARGERKTKEALTLTLVLTHAFPYEVKLSEIPGGCVFCRIDAPHDRILDRSRTADISRALHADHDSAGLNKQRGANALDRTCDRQPSEPQSRLNTGLSPECPRQESNLDLPLRRRSSYPLDYEGKGRPALHVRRRHQAKASAARR
jgi:hypothetical protein